MAKQTQEQIKETLLGMLLEITGAEKEPDAVIIGKGGMLDSVTAYAFICRVEEFFGVDIIETDLNLDACRTVATLALFISEAVE